VICKDQEECNVVYKQLKLSNNAKKLTQINSDDETISEGIIVLPVQIARG
jgi:DNA helicase IV